MADDNERQLRRPADTIELKLAMSEAARRQLKILAADAGCSMSSLVAAWINDNWKQSSIFQKRMEEEGRWWTDERGALRNPDGTVWKKGDLSNHNPKGGTR